MHRERGDEPVLITSARTSYQDEYVQRRRKYAVMMTIRTLCVIAAGLTYQISTWLALAFVVGGAALPWCAVMIANDRPPRRRGRDPQLTAAAGTERALPPSPQDGRTVDG